jgi:hypothetical protein
VKTAVSLPDELFEAGERLADRLGWSRSQRYARALEGFVAQSADDEVTARLDEVYDADADGVDGDSTSTSDAALGVRAGRALIDSGAWEW